ncbi:hypothetical protein CRENBAI_007797 [Crenichthys baileyi]|uniref:Uncharacterized protein n=1 Tax=Crenichthys baileyi TaxID=28760 RepID=A0AAV9RMR6_9TELE
MVDSVKIITTERLGVSGYLFGVDLRMQMDKKQRGVEAEKTLHCPAGLLVPQSAYIGSSLAIPCPGTAPFSCRSSSPLLCPVAKPTCSSWRKKRCHDAASCFSAGKEEVPMSADAKAAVPVLFHSKFFQALTCQNCNSKACCDFAHAISSPYYQGNA